MNETTRQALYVILISLVLAFIFNYLFFGKEPGISVFVIAICLLIAVFAFSYNQKLPTKKVLWLVPLIGFFSFMPAMRANEFLTFLNVCATFGLLMLLAHSLAGTPAFLMKLLDYFVLVIVVPFRMLRRALYSLSLIGQIHSSVKNRDVWVRVIKGVLMAVPILIIFGVLFSQADLAFSQFVNGIVKINISERTVQYTVLLVFAFAAALSYLSYIFLPKQAEPVLPKEQVDSGARTGKGIEILVFLGLIAALFLLFIGFQVTYLFGGEANIVNAGFTYSEYARRGFFELLAVAFLSLVVLLASAKYAGVETKADRKFLISALILIAEVVIVMGSAFKRLALYIDAYGMTGLRFFVAAFIILLLVLFTLLTIKFIASKKEQFFTFSALLSIAAFIVVVSIINPDAFIAKYNIDQYNRTGKIDIEYMGQLSPDAEAGKIELYNRLSGDEKARLGEFLAGDRERLEGFSEHWQSYNYSREQALKILHGL